MLLMVTASLALNKSVPLSFIWVYQPISKRGRGRLCSIHLNATHCAEVDLLYVNNVISLHQHVKRSLWTPVGTVEKFIWRKLLFVFYLNCWELAPPVTHWCTKLEEGTKQLHGSLKQTVCLQLHNSFPFSQNVISTFLNCLISLGEVWTQLIFRLESTKTHLKCLYVTYLCLIFYDKWKIMLFVINYCL